MAQSITEGLFPSVAGLFSPVGGEQARQLEMAGRPVDPLSAVSGDIGFLGERMQQGIGSAFGQMPEQDRKRMQAQQAAQELQQQGVDVSTPQGLLALAQRLDALPGFSGESLAIRQAAAQMAQQQQTAGLEQERIRAQTGLAQAQTQKAMQPTAIQPRAKMVTDLGDRVRIEDPNTGDVTYERKGMTPSAVSADERRQAQGEINPGYDKFGRYTNKFGEVFSNTEMAKKRTEIEELEKILDNLNKIGAQDVRDAESFVDYTSGEVSKAVGGALRPNTKDAQTRIAASKILKQMESLPPGAASDADMRTAASTFPGFSDAEGLAKWVNDTKDVIQTVLTRYQDRYDIRPKVQFTAPIELNGQRSRRGQGGRPVSAPPPTAGVPAGVDPAVWSVMTPEEKALWQ